MPQLFQQNVPPPQQPFVDANGVLTKAGLDFFVSILNQAAQSIATDAVATGIVASGTTIATAAMLTADFNRVDVAPGSGLSESGVILQSRQPGQIQKVFNNALHSVNVYAPPGVQIDALGVNVPYSLAIAKLQIFEWVTTTQINSTQLG